MPLASSPDWHLDSLSENFRRGEADRAGRRPPDCKLTVWHGSAAAVRARPGPHPAVPGCRGVSVQLSEA